MRVSHVMVIACGLWLSACGDKPTTPSPPLNLTGTWTGTWTFVSGGANVSDSVTMTLTQTGSAAGGSWSATGNAAGNVSFPATADFTGTANISQTLIIGGNCSASTTLTGTATSSQIRFTLGALTPTALCQWAPSHQFTFNR